MPATLSECKVLDFFNLASSTTKELLINYLIIMLFGNRRPVDFPVLLNPQANSTTQAEGSSSDTISNITTLTLICANLCLKYGLKL